MQLRTRAISDRWAEWHAIAASEKKKTRWGFLWLPVASVVFFRDVGHMYSVWWEEEKRIEIPKHWGEKIPLARRRVRTFALQSLPSIEIEGKQDAIWARQACAGTHFQLRCITTSASRVYQRLTNHHNSTCMSIIHAVWSLHFIIIFLFLFVFFFLSNLWRKIEYVIY